MLRKVSLLLVTVILVIVISGQGIGAASEPEGLLLGLRYQAGPDSRPEYASLFIAGQGESVSVTEGPAGEKSATGLMVARKTGFWFVDVVRMWYGQNDEEYLAAGPVEKDSLFSAPLIYGETSGIQRISDIHFVSGKYVAVKEWGGGYWYGAAHPIEAHGLCFFSMDDLKTPLPIDQVLGKNALDAFHAAAEQYLAKHPSDALAESAEPSNWSIVRKNGHWSLQGLIGYSAEVFRGTYAFFDVPFQLPAAVVEHDVLKPSWAVIRRENPKVVDAFASPRGGLLVILTKDRLLFYSRPTDNSLGRLAGQTEIPAGSQAVLAQWSVGSYAAKWEASYLSHFYGEWWLDFRKMNP